jgi:hypothetical protein
MADERPYLSLVVTARNDDHGGNLLGRMQAFVNGWIEQSKRRRLDSELIVVEWNPPEDRPRLVDALHWPEDLGPCRVRIIQVPPDVHRRYVHAEALPLYQMMAKNAGIRRARGRFVLATNIDIIFSDELVGFLAERKLQPQRMYRIDRHDVMPEVPVDGIDEQLMYCRTHLIRINAREGTFNLTPQGRRAPSSSDIASIDSGITFGPGWFPVERVSATENFRWATTCAELRLAPPFPGMRHLRLDMEPGPGAGNQPLEVLLMSAQGEQLARTTVYSRGVLRVPVEASAGEAPFVIRFRVLNGGRSIPLDTRILEFRVFRCDWDSETQDEPITPPPPPKIQAQERDGDPVTQEEPIGQSSIPVDRASGRPLNLWERFQRFVEMVAYGEDIVLVPVTVPHWVKRVLKFYVDHGGFTGLLRPGFKREKIVPASMPIAAAPPIAATPPTGISVVPPQDPPQVSPQSQPPTIVPAPLGEMSVNLQQSQLHTNGCGDFTLMALENWCDLRGYPEFDTFSMHLDSVFCFSAHYSGVVEEVLQEPMRIYHIEHGSGSGWTPEGQAKLFARIAERGLAMIENPEVIGWAKQMQKLRCPMIFNLQNWGLADVNLPETTVVSEFVKSV